LQSIDEGFWKKSVLLASNFGQMCLKPVVLFMLKSLFIKLNICTFMLKGKSLFMPLRVLLTGKLHGPDMGASVVLLYKAGTSDVVAPEAGFVTLDERFKMLRQINWETLSKDQPVKETAASV